MRTERWKAASTWARAGSALSPPTRIPPTRTPVGIVRVGVEAGAAAQARPAATAISASVRRTRSTGRKLEQVSPRISRGFFEDPSDAGRTLDSPMATGTWQLAPCSFGDVVRLAEALELDEVTASVLVRRGLADTADARRFLEGALPGHDPFLLGDMTEAVEAIVAAVGAGSRICVHGDYDADGICATALAALLLRELGADVSWH